VIGGVLFGLFLWASIAPPGVSEAGSRSAVTTANITINDSGDATPLPSMVDMEMLPTDQFVTHVSVFLGALSHTFPSDIDILLVAPSGESVMLMSDAGASHEVSDVHLRFDDCAQTLLPGFGQILSGTYRPTNFNIGGASWETIGTAADTFVIHQQGSSLLSFVGRQASFYNGFWSLHVSDDTAGNSGSISGWGVVVSYGPTQPAAPSCAPDFDQDGVPDLVVGAGPGGGPHVEVLSGATGAPLRSFFAYAPSFTGGVHVATCDFNGDGIPDIVTGAGAGGGPHVRVFDGATGTPLAGPLGGGFFAYAPAFTGGAFVACADMNNDGVPDIIVGPGPGGGPHVRVFDGRTGLPLAGLLGGGLFPYPLNFTGGVFVGP
jgi:subtilisin-like proprotein convertase family protein